MSDFVSTLESVEEAKLKVGAALRHVIFNKLTPILLSCDKIEDLSTKLMIQASCSDVVSNLEKLINEYGLDSDELY